MAKLSSGILGGISGTVGNVVGGRWRGIDYIRSKPVNVKNPNTEAQQAQRMRFKLVIEFLKRIRPLIRVGFQNGERNQTFFNRAMSVNLKEAVGCTFPDLALDAHAGICRRGVVRTRESCDGRFGSGGGNYHMDQQRWQRQRF